MDPIKLTGTQIVDTRKMKQSGRYRVTLELTEEDTKFNGGTLAVAEINDLLADVVLTFTEIQGNNNSFEKDLEKNIGHLGQKQDKMAGGMATASQGTPGKKQEETIYEEFKRKCIEYSGEKYYNNVKKCLGVAHLRDLLKKHSESFIEDIFKCQIEFMNSKMYMYPFEEACLDLTHKDNSYRQWEIYFEDFNNKKMNKTQYEKKLLKLKESAAKKEKRLQKRLFLQKNKSSKSDLKKDLQKLVNKYVRLQEKSCYTCFKYLPYPKRTAGHFWTQGGHQRTRFELMNIHTQCVSCNSFKSGNLAPYAARLLEQYGAVAFQALHRRANDPTPFDKEFLEQEIKNYKILLSKKA